jgi:inorganic triphosphatase YgiF
MMVKIQTKEAHTMGQEIERKFVCSQETFEQLKKDFPGGTPIEMETTYYDTFDGKLNNRHWTLRRRFENGVSVCTLKTPTETGERNEWEVEALSIMAAIPMLVQAGAPMELMALSVSGLMEVCGAKFTRLALLIPLEDGAVELALDEGKLLGGGREAPIREVEVELKEGSLETTLIFATVLAKKYNLTPESKSKYKRAMALAMGK